MEGSFPKQPIDSVGKDPFIEEPDGKVVTDEIQDPCSSKQLFDKATPTQESHPMGETATASAAITNILPQCNELAADGKHKLCKQERRKVLQKDRVTRHTTKAKKQLDILIRICNKFKDCKKAMKYILKTSVIRKIEENTTPVAARLLAKQLESGKKALCGRRFTMDEQVYALSLFKRAPKAYKIVQTKFAVPSPRTLISLLNRVPFPPGVDTSMFAHLREKVSKMNVSNRTCALLFDKVPLIPDIEVSGRQRMIIGFADFGDLGREKAIADHALIFMIRGLSKKWKQPVAYFFYKNTEETRRLESLIIKVIESLQGIGLHVLCTICNEETTNSTALQNLVAARPSNVKIDKPGMIFTVNNENIAVIYNPPQLLVNTRDAFMENNVVWTSGPRSRKYGTKSLFSASTPLEKSEASWDHVKVFAEMNNVPGNKWALAPKLTQSHVEPNDEEKKIVSLAAEMMSYKVSAGIHVMILFNPALHGNTPTHVFSMPASAIATVHFVCDVDRLFDSFNGRVVTAVDQKHYRVALTDKSIHTTFWPEIASLIDSWEFTDRTTGTVKRFSFQDGWLTSIAGATHVATVLREKYKVQVLRTRSLNLDPLNNLAYMISQNGPDGTSLTCYQFTSALKTIVINNLLKLPRRGYTRLNDGDVLITNLRTFLWPNFLQLISAELEAIESKKHVPKDLPFESFGYEDISHEIDNESAEIDPETYEDISHEMDNENEEIDPDTDELFKNLPEGLLF